MNVYITIASAKAIIYKVQIIDLPTHGEVYYKKIRFFSKFENKALLAFKELLTNPEGFYNSYYIPHRKQVNTDFVFSAGPPSYHNDPNCKYLNSDYENYRIPKEIKKKGKETIKEYREWFKKNYYLLKNERKDARTSLEI